MLSSTGQRRESARSADPDRALAAVRRAFLVASLRSGLAALAGGSALAAVVAGVRLSWGEVGAPSAGAWLTAVGMAAPASWSVLLPGAAAFGVTATMARLEESGGWTALRASGRSGRALLPAVARLGLLTAALTGTMTLWAEPTLLRAARRQVAAGVARPVPGVPWRAGDLTVWVDEDAPDRVLVASPDLLATGRLVSVGPDEDGWSLVLADGRWARPDDPTWWTSAARVSWPLPAPAARVELAERGTGELAAHVEATRARGGAWAYERSVLLERFLHPLASGLLPLAVLPLGTGRRPWLGLAGLGVGFLVVARLGDHLAATLGAGAAASAGLAWVLGAALVVWARWVDR